MRIGGGIRLRHWRGKGIHSPFMYGLVREVFMKRGVCGHDRGLYDRLREMKLGRRNSAVLQNLFSFCELDSYDIFTVESVCVPVSGLSICVVNNDMQELPAEKYILQLVQTGGILAVAYKHSTAGNCSAELDIADKYNCVSVQMPDMFLYFFDPKLQKQHYKL